jgi:hypothetical protein
MWRLLLVISISTMLFSCKETVDCEKLEKKLSNCMMENYKNVNKKGRPLDDKKYSQDKSDLSAKYLKAIEDNFVKECKTNKGRDSRATKINKCLKETSCAAIENCLKSVLQ